MDEEFDFPEDMRPADVANTCTAYLIGSQAFSNPYETSIGLRRYGPFLQGDKWQLDHSNDYWLRIDGHHARLTCRYPIQQVTIAAMKTLFMCRYLVQAADIRT